MEFFQLLVFLFVFLFPSFNQASNPEEAVMQLFKGFIEGVGSETNVSDISPCIHDAEDILENIEQASKNIEIRTVGSIWDAIQLYTAAFKPLPIAIRDCVGAIDEIAQIERALTAFSHPTTFLIENAYRIYENKQEITTDIDDSIQAWKSQNYEKVGFYIGEAIGKVVFGESFRISVTQENIPEILRGVLASFGSQTHLDNIANCLNFEQGFNENITNASLNLLSNEKDKVLNGITILANSLKILPKAIRLCNGGENDAILIEDALNHFERPYYFIFNPDKNILIDGVQVYTQIFNATTSYQNQNWYSYGYNIGLAFAFSTWGKSSAIGAYPQDIAEFAYGILLGIGEEEHWPEIKECIMGSEETFLLLQQAYNNLTLHTADNIKQGLYALSQAMQLVPKAIGECKASIKDFESLIEAIKVFESPISFAYHIGKSLVLNGYEIYCDIEGAITAYKAQSWTQFGYYIGKALTILVLKDSNTLNQEYAMFINQRVSWNANISPLFKGSSLEDINELFLSGETNFSQYECNIVDYTDIAENLPSSFNAIEQGPFFPASKELVMNPKSIQYLLFHYGPVQANMIIYEDFLYYQNGVYKQLGGRQIGVHTVKIIGWGQHAETNYWIVANSWGSNWGENSTFRISFGECGIDSKAVSNVFLSGVDIIRD